MSRLGKKPIIIPNEISVEIKSDEVKVTGPKGELKLTIRPELGVEIKDNQIFIFRKTKDKLGRSLHGLSRTLLLNMIEGVKSGWSKQLRLVGTGYRAEMKGENLVLHLGFSHPVEIKPETGIKFEVKESEVIMVLGTDKTLVGQAAARIRNIKPPEPYKGKGIRYEGEVVRRKPGKAAKVGVAGFGSAKS